MFIARLGVGVCCAVMCWGQEPPTWDEQARQKRAAKAYTAPSDAADRRYFLRALGVHWKQVQAGKLAIKKTTTAQVTQLAQQLMEDHQKSSDALLALAHRKGWDLPAPFDGDASRDKSASTRSSNAPSRRPSNTREIQTRGASGGLSPDTYASMRGEARMDGLNALSGRQFDLRYLEQVIADHEGLRGEVAGDLKNVKDEEIRASALTAVKAAEQHVARARGVKDTLGSDAASGKNRQ